MKGSHRQHRPPDRPGTVTAGKPREQVIAVIREAVTLHVEELKRQGIAVPKPTCEGEFVEIEAA